MAVVEKMWLLKDGVCREGDVSEKMACGEKMVCVEK
jgi:hypothetical protein